ncbi:hypothetical protein [Thalassotalea algicola]|uniref:hypothetical protein n=1 Tax=Thalassotalea algicola TaxID=2716224 RepID=UPI00145D3615|nr:hypothetical protein [Thalassotalea algicola]
MNTFCFSLALIIGLSGCNSSGSVSPEEQADKSTSSSLPKLSDYDANLPIPNNQQVADFKVLFFGNSHIGGIPNKIKAMVETTMPDKTIEVETAPGNDYLAERIRDSRSVNLLRNESWSHLILQAQKYSQSGAIDYPTTAAQTWIRMAKHHNVTPILFPEHPQAGNITEGQRVHDIHESIALNEASCVSPVGLAWDKAISLDPSLKYHSGDGNHAATTGTVLTSLVLFQVITGYSADLVPHIESLNVSEQTQQFLGQIAAQTIAENNVCEY